MKTYNCKRVVGSWLGIPVRGLMRGTHIKAARDEKAFSLDVGAHGDATAIQNHNKAGKAVFTLQQQSPTNDLFSAKMRLAEIGGLIKNITRGALLLEEFNGTTIIDASDAFLEGFADVEYSTEGTGREWTFLCPELEVFVGGLLF